MQYAPNTKKVFALDQMGMEIGLKKCLMTGLFESLDKVAHAD